MWIKMMKLGEHRAWSREELEAFETRWPLGSMERTGYALALFTGQRRADLAALKFASIAGGSFRVKQAKTGVELLIPIHPELREALAAVHPRHEAAILTLKSGKAMNPIYFGHLMAAAIEDRGGRAARGLRIARPAQVCGRGAHRCRLHSASGRGDHRTHHHANA
jgi:integrase